jgi:hypothetical protein
MATETPSVLVEVIRGVPRTNTRIMAREYGFSLADMQEQFMRQRILTGDIKFWDGNIDVLEYVAENGAIKRDVGISRDLFDVMTRSAPTAEAKDLRSRFLEAFDLAQRQTVEEQAARLEQARCACRAARQHALDVVPAAGRR